MTTVGTAATKTSYFPCVLSLVSLPPRAQVQCPAVVLDMLTGAARWRMMKWGGMYTGTCSGNQTAFVLVCLFVFFFLFFMIHSKHCLYWEPVFTHCVTVTGEGSWVQRSPRERERPPLAPLGGMSFIWPLNSEYQQNILLLIKHWFLNLGQINLLTYMTASMWRFPAQPFSCCYCLFVEMGGKPVFLLQLWLQRGRKHRDRRGCAATATEADKLWQKHIGLWPIH